VGDGGDRNVLEMSETKDTEDDRPEISFDDIESTTDQGDKTGALAGLNPITELTREIDSTNPLAIQKSLRAGFVVTLIVGSAFIYVFRSTGAWNIVFCLSVMFAYGWYGNKRVFTTTAKAVFADSFYYLGFLFTFVALIVTMLGVSTEAGDFNAQAIVGQFGPALATTVVGMAVRIYITQFDAITSEPETEILSGLGDLSSNLSSAVSDLQIMIKQHVEASEKQQKRNLKLTEKFSSQIASLDFQPAVGALREFGSELTSLGSQVDLLSKATGQVELTVEDLTSSVYGTTSELNKAREEFGRYKEIGQEFDDARRTLIEVSEVAGTLKQNLDSSANVNVLRTIKNLDAKASGIDRNLQTASNRIDRLSEAASEANEELGTSLVELREASAAVTEVTTTMRQLDQLSNQLVAARNTVAGVANAVEDINQSIAAEVRKAQAELGKTTAVTEEMLRQQVAPIARAIESVARDFEPVQENLRELDLKVRRSIADVLDFLNR